MFADDSVEKLKQSIVVKNTMIEAYSLSKSDIYIF